MAAVKNIAVRLMFDGSEYHGWQVQKADISVAGTIEAALSRLCGHPVRVNGCGRTDAGVHAESYCFNFRTSSTIPLERLPLAVNSLLPPDISVLRAVIADDSFDANLSCIKKEYTYRIYNSHIRDPFLYRKAYFYTRDLDISAMTKAAGFFTGKRDFAAFRSVGTVTKTTVRTVFYVEIERRERLFEFRICADGFLYNMARTMVGTLLYVSEGKILPSGIPNLIEQKTRGYAGPTVPPHGLYMTRVWYDGVVGEMME